MQSRTATPHAPRRATCNPLLAEMADRTQLMAEHPDAPGVCRSLIGAVYSVVRVTLAGGH